MGTSGKLLQVLGFKANRMHHHITIRMGHKIHFICFHAQCEYNGVIKMLKDFFICFVCQFLVQVFLQIIAVRDILHQWIFYFVDGIS